MRTLAYVLTVLFYLAAIAYVVWLLRIRLRHQVKDLLSGALQLVALYTLILGFLSTAGVFGPFDWLQRGLTSQDPLRFLAANFHAFALLFGGLGVALNPHTASSPAVFLLGLPVLLAGALLLFAYAIIHFLVVVPIAYFGYLLTSVPVDAILNSAGDVQFAAGGRAIQIKELVRQNEVAIRNFMVALPAFMTSLILKVAPLLRRRRGPAEK